MQARRQEGRQEGTLLIIVVFEISIHSYHAASHSLTHSLTRSCKAQWRLLPAATTNAQQRQRPALSLCLTRGWLVLSSPTSRARAVPLLCIRRCSRQQMRLRVIFTFIGRKSKVQNQLCHRKSKQESEPCVTTHHVA